jgi:transcriptional antiterminator NusG
MEWFAVHTKPRHEKAVSKILEFKGLEAFLPSYRARRQWSDRTNQLDLPLFPGYTFCQLDLAARVKVLETPGVFEIVRFGREYAPVNRNEIESLQRLMRSGLQCEPWPRIEIGESVVIDRGPLSGCGGVLVEIRKQIRLLLFVTILGRAVSVEVDRRWVKPASRDHQNRVRFLMPASLEKNRYEISARN